jgi:hypothetical protein
MVACSGSTSTTPPAADTARVAEAHAFDALLGNACNPTHTYRCVFLSYFALAPALGAVSAPVTVHIGSTTSTWRGFVYDVVDLDPQNHVSDSLLTVMLFSDTSVTSGLVVWARPGSTTFWRLSDTMNVETLTSNASYDLTAASRGTACTTPPTLQYTTVPPFNVAESCFVDQFSIGFTTTFDSSGVTVTVPSQSMPGIRLIEPATSNGYPSN